MIGFALVVIGTLTSDVGEWYEEYIGLEVAARLLFQAFGRMLATTIVLSDAFFRMTITNWKIDELRRQDGQATRIDELFDAIEGGIRKSASTSTNTDIENGGSEHDMTQHSNTKRSSLGANGISTSEEEVLEDTGHGASSSEPQETIGVDDKI